MKTTLVISLISAAMLTAAFGQDPAAPPPAPTAPGLEAATTPPTVTPPAPAAAATAIPSATIRDDRDDDEDLERAIERKVKRGLSITFGDDKDKNRAGRRARRGDIDVQIDENVERAIERHVEDGALMAIPIILIIFTTLFGAPVLIVGVIMFFSYIKARSLHKTVRLMVEKGQPVPEALFAAPHTPAKQRSDMRRGVILVMIGIGLMILFGAMDDWDGGAWALGIIPFLIGAGYLAVWKLEGNKFTFDKAGTDNPPPLP